MSSKILNGSTLLLISSAQAIFDGFGGRGKNEGVTGPLKGEDCPSERKK